MTPEKYIICNYKNCTDVIAFQVTKVNSANCYILAESHIFDTDPHPIRESIEYEEEKDDCIPPHLEPFGGFICYPCKGGVTIIHKRLGRLFRIEGNKVTKIFCSKIQIKEYTDFESSNAVYERVFLEACRKSLINFAVPRITESL